MCEKYTGKKTVKWPSTVPATCWGGGDAPCVLCICGSDVSSDVNFFFNVQQTI